MTEDVRFESDERAYGMALSSTTGNSPADFVMRDAGAAIGRLCDALSASLAREEVLRKALARAATRLDMVTPLIIENKSAFAVTKWAKEARSALQEQANEQ